MISIRPSPCADEKLGASADTSHLYTPLDLSVNLLSITRTLFEFSCCNNKKMHVIKIFPNQIYM